MQSHLNSLRFKVAHYSKFENYETVKGGCVPSKNKFKEKNNKLRWLATDINFNCYTLGVLLLMAAQ